MSKMKMTRVKMMICVHACVSDLLTSSFYVHFCGGGGDVDGSH